jgi:hypothetical protein
LVLCGHACYLLLLIFLPQVLPGRDFLQFLEFKNGDFCDPDAPPLAADHAAAQAAPCPAPSHVDAGCEHQLLSGAGQEEQHRDTLSVTWDPQWLLITRLFHPLFPSTPSAVLPPHANALAALTSATADCSLLPPPFELPAAPVVDPASNLQVPMCSQLLRSPFRSLTSCSPSDRCFTEAAAAPALVLLFSRAAEASPGTRVWLHTVRWSGAGCSRFASWQQPRGRIFSVESGCNIRLF